MMDLLTDPMPGESVNTPSHYNVQQQLSTTEYFAENFWGEKNLGYNVLYQNMKHGQISVKDLQDFVRESASAEELYAKHMTKLAKQASNCSPAGSFAPLMEVLKVMTEKISSCHMDIVLKLHDIIKELSKYAEEQKNKHKQNKDSFTATSESLHNLQIATNSVTKSKEKYNQCSLEEVRLKSAVNAQQKDMEKAANKSRKASEEYQNQVGKHAVTRHKFEENMYEAAQQFQKIEKEHLQHMKSVLDTYILSFENAHVLINQVHQEFRRQVNESTVSFLLQHYSEHKGTGTERPTTILFEKFNPVSMPSPVVENGTSNHGNSSDGSQTIPAPQPPVKNKKEGGLFGIRRKKPKQKNDISTNSTSSKDSKDAESIESPGKEPEYQIDEEGFTIRPDSSGPSDKNSFQFSSDSDSSESDSDDPSTRKIQVHIKPKEATTTDSGGSDLETLNAITKNLTLGSPSPLLSSSKQLSRSSPMNQSSKSEKMTTDQLLQLFDGNSNKSSDSQNHVTSSSDGSSKIQPNDVSSSSKPIKPPPTTERKLSLKKGPAPPIPQSESSKSLDDILNITEMGSASDIDLDIPPPRPPKPGRPTPPLVPQNRPTELTVVNAARPASQEPAKPAPLASSESWSSLSSAGGGGTPTVDSSIPSFASLSRGPSPLTLSHNDPIPIAIAFIETVNAFFKSNETLTKTTGDVQISFPAGITRAFTSNPNPPVLSFKINCSGTINNITYDKNLVRKDQFASEPQSHVFNFDMPSLVGHIKGMTEKEPNSPHYNIHVLSYVLPSSHGTLPLHLSSTWKCEPTTTDLKIEYKYNSQASASSLQSLNVIVPIHGTVSNMQSTPKSIWNAAQNRLCWQLPGKINSSADSGSLQSTLTMSSGPSKPSALAVQFCSEGSTLSGADFELFGVGYRVSLIKKRFMTGKYLCENG